MLGLQTGATLKQFAIIVVASFTILDLGLGLAWLSPVLVKISSQNQTVLSRPATVDEGAWMVSASVLLGLVGLPFAGYFADNFGRKRTLVIFSVPRLVGGIIPLLATEMWMLILSRSLCGVSDLVHLSVASTYSSEVASKEIRGALGAISQIMSSLGALIMLSVGPFMSFQHINIMLIAIFVATTAPLPLLPESPYFLYSQGRSEESLKVLTLLRGSPTVAQEEMLQYSSVTKTNLVLKELLADKLLLKSIIKVIILATLSELIGYNLIAYYLQTIFESTHTNVSSEISSLIIGCIQMLACLCTTLLTDRLGRKPILGISLTGMAIGMAGLGTFFKLTSDVDEIVGFLNYLPLISVALVIFCFNAGLGSIIWTLIAEQFEDHFRAHGLAIGVFISAVFAFVSSNYLPKMVLAVGAPPTYYMLTGICVITGLYIGIFFNETKGKAFAEIQKEMGRISNVDREDNVTKTAYTL